MNDHHGTAESAIPLSTVFFATAALLLSLLYVGPRTSLSLLAGCFLVVMVWLGWGLRKQKQLARHSKAFGWLPAVVGLYLVWLAVNPYLSIYPNVSFLDAVQFAGLPLVFFASIATAGNAPDHRPNASRLRFGLLVIGLILGLWGTVDFVFVRERAHGSLLDPNVYAAVLNLFLIPTCIYYIANQAIETRKKTQYLLLFSIAAIAIFQFMALSRGATLGLVLAIASGFFLFRRVPGSKQRLLVLLAILAVTYSVVRITAPEIYATRMEQVSVEKDPSMSQRLMLWQATWRMFRDGNMLSGSGLGTFRVIYPRYRPTSDETGGYFAHNDYLQALPEGGIIHFALLIAITVFAPLTLLGSVIWQKHNASLQPKQVVEIAGLMLALLAISIHAFFNFVHQITSIAILTGLYLARVWTIVAPNQTLPLPQPIVKRISPPFVRIALLLAIVLPTTALLADALIFFTFTGDSPVIARLTPQQRAHVVALSLTFRPSNLVARETYIRGLVNYLEQMRPSEEKAGMTKLTLDELDAAEASAPGVPLWSFLRAKVYLLEMSPKNIERALNYLERAVAMAPHVPEFRVALLHLLRQVDALDRARQIASAGKLWLRYTDDIASTYRLVDESRDLAMSLGNKSDEVYWSNIRHQLDTLVEKKSLFRQPSESS